MHRTIRPELQVAADVDNHLGESPIWQPFDQALYWLNCENPPRIYRYDPLSGAIQYHELPQRAGGLALARDGSLVLALRDGIYRYEFARDTLELIVVNPKVAAAAFHECQCDRNGRLWIGNYDYRVGPGALDPRGGSLFKLDASGLATVLEEVSCSNGLAVSSDGRTLYHTRAPGQPVCAFAIDPLDGSLSGEKVFADAPVEEGVFDGATVDAEGAYWVTRTFGSALHRYLPDGSLDLVVELPFGNPTKMAFGGADMATMYVTTTQIAFGAERPGRSMLGGLFAFRPGVAGAEEPAFLL